MIFDYVESQWEDLRSEGPEREAVVGAAVAIYSS